MRGRATRHQCDVIRIEQQYLARIFEITEVDDFDVWKILISTVAQSLANRIATGNAEIAFGYGEL